MARAEAGQGPASVLVQVPHIFQFKRSLQVAQKGEGRRAYRAGGPLKGRTGDVLLSARGVLPLLFTRPHPPIGVIQIRASLGSRIEGEGRLSGGSGGLQLILAESP